MFDRPGGIADFVELSLGDRRDFRMGGHAHLKLPAAVQKSDRLRARHFAPSFSSAWVA
jgi:hypothetical protein